MDTYVTTGVDRVTAGSLFKRSARIWMRHFVAFTALGLLVQLPTLLIFVAGGRALLADKSLMGWVGGAGNALQNLAVALLAHGVVTELRGQPLVFGESLRIGLRSLGTSLGVGLALALLVALGHFAYNIPGLFLQTAFLLAVPAAVIERAGFALAFRRSWTLSSGHRWSLFGCMLLVGLCTIAAGGVAALAYRHGRAWTPELRNGVIYVMAGGSALLGAWMPVLANVAFHDLRRLKEGVDVSSLTRVFE
jgi:hypothetical protein